MSYERDQGDQFFPPPDWALRESYAGEVLRRGAAKPGASVAIARAARVPYTIARFNSPVSSSNTTNEEVLAEIVVPGKSLGKNGGLRISVWPISEGANTGTRDIFIRYGGAFLGEGRVSTAAQASTSGMTWWEIWNTESESAQIGQPPTTRPLDMVQSPAANKTAAVNTAVDQVLQIRSKKSVGTDDLRLLRWQVEVLPPLE